MPKDWKRANITPIFKGGSKENPLNYRPMSLSSVMGKMCERVIKVRWMEHLERHKVLTNCQFGFRKGRSCFTNLLSFYSRVIDVIQEGDGWVDGVYLDLKKAFDKVPHRRLIWKIEKYGGIGGRLLEWMEDYLHDREMRTAIRDQCSSWLKVTSGVPQGSVLGPLMFVIYINDLSHEVDSYINLFADDAKLMRKVENVNDCMMLQNDLNKINSWNKSWQMEFNLSKCKVMEFGKSKKRVRYDYEMNGVRLEKSKEVDLGVTVTEDLTPDKHIDKIAGGMMNLLKRVRVAFLYLDERMIKKILTSVVRPRLEYAAVVWSPHKKKNIARLERVERAVTKMVPEMGTLT